jgi:hypothetical protein
VVERAGVRGRRLSDRLFRRLRGLFQAVPGLVGARFAITSNLAGGEQQVDGTGALPAGQWVHVAVTLSGNYGALTADEVAALWRGDSP